MKSKKTSELKQMIAGAIKRCPPSMRTKALMSCQWRLRSPDGRLAALDRFATPYLTTEQDPRGHVVFDGRDNEDLKLATFERALGPLSVEILSQVK